MDKINFNIKSWCALSAGLANQEDWLNWSKNNRQWPELLTPPVFDLIAPMVRRRMSGLSKLAVQTALQIAQDEQVDYIVFSSRHGELTRTVSLLEEIVKGEDASPMAFSQSVHNTAAGLFTICSGRATPVTSLAAGDHCLPSAIIEAYCYLVENPKGQVLLVDFDQPLPPIYRQFETQEYQGYALAMLIETGQQFSLQSQLLKESVQIELPQSLHCINFLVNNQQQMNLHVNNKQWIWTKNNDLCTTAQ